MYYVGATIKSNMEDWSVIVREQSAITLWALAGSLKPQRKQIAERIGIQQIVNMIMAKSEKLQYVGAKCMISLVIESRHYQNIILKENGVDSLIKLLRAENSSHRVLLSVVETVGAMCVDIAHVNNRLAQNELAEKEAGTLLLELVRNPPSKLVQIEATHALACLMLNKRPQDDEDNPIHLDVSYVVDLIDTDDLDMRLKAGLAIAVLAFNNHEKQYEIKRNGGISYEWYKVFFEEEKMNDLYVCRACFQIIVLARIINDRPQVWITAMGISRLVELLLHKDDQIVIQTASYMSSLAHTRVGITDAMVTCDAVDILCDRLYSVNDQIRTASAIALGYLTYNRTASRLLLHNCRNVTHLFGVLTSTLKPEHKISKQFLESYETAMQQGLPKLLVNGKLKVVSASNAILPREETFEGFYKGHMIDFEERLIQTLPYSIEDYGHEERNYKSQSSEFRSKALRAQSAPIKQQTDTRLRGEKVQSVSQMGNRKDNLIKAKLGEGTRSVSQMGRRVAKL